MLLMANFMRGVSARLRGTLAATSVNHLKRERYPLPTTDA
jgi:hypothetical protein